MFAVVYLNYKEFSDSFHHIFYKICKKYYNLVIFMIKEIGKLNLGSKHTHLKMWQVIVPGGYRGAREHRHINYEIGLVLDGTGIYRTTCGDREINKGDIFIFTSNEPHCITNITSDNLKLLNIQFSNRIIENIPDLNHNYPYLIFNHSSLFDCRIDSKNSAKIKEKILMIENEFCEKKMGYKCAVSSLVSQIFIELIRNHNYYETEENLSKSIITKLQDGIDYINEHYTENITLEEIAEKSNITPNYFTTLFKECLNMKLWDYITAKRIEKAQRILIKNDSELSILQIANECGFNNTANFNRSFKLHTGITPSEYRKNQYKGII